jgi:hypothetical protein
MRRPLGFALLAAILTAGCGTTGKNFKITSYPSGATIFLDGDRWGQTDADKVFVDFKSADQLVTLRLQKDGFQPTGAVLTYESPGEMAFFLQEAPNNQKILEVLRSIRDVLDQISTQMSAEAAK